MVSEAVDRLLEMAKQFVGSNLFGTLVTAAFGAFAGAYLAGRVQHKRAVVAELNSIKAALSLCFTICKAFDSRKEWSLSLYRTVRRLAQDV